jgi:hypothetical protein
MQLGSDYRPDKMEELDSPMLGIAHRGETFLQDHANLYPDTYIEPAGQIYTTAVNAPESIITGIPKYVNDDTDLYREYTSPEAIARRTTLAHFMRSYVELLPVSDAMGLAMRDRVLTKHGYPSIMTDDRRLAGPSAELFRVLREMAETGQYSDYFINRYRAGREGPI